MEDRVIPPPTWWNQPVDRRMLASAVAVEQPSDWRVFLAAAVAAVATDLALRSGVASVGGLTLVLVVVAGMLLSGRVTNPEAAVLIGSSALFGGWLAWRMSPWLLPLDVAATALLLVAGASLARGGSIFDMTLPAAMSRAVHAAFHGLAGPSFLARPFITVDPDRRRAVTAVAVLRGVVMAIPVVTVLGLLLGSADAVFAGFFRFWSPGEAVGHVVLFVVGAWGMAGLLRLASAEGCPPPPTFAVRIGPVEATVVLGSLAALFTAFALAQLVVLLDGGRHVIETAGLTYAEYARTGFFQLLAVAALTLAVLAAFRPLIEVEDRALRIRLTVLAEACVGLTLVVVAVALRRLSLYEDAFGLTMLRLFSQAFALWIAITIAMLGVALARVGRTRSWFPGAAAVAGLVVLFVLNVVNPEAMVVRRNVDHALHTGRFDPGYLASLSHDAIPAMASSLPKLPPADQAVVLEAVCRPTGRVGSGWAAGNHSEGEADRVRDRVCVGPTRLAPVSGPDLYGP